HAGRGPRRGGEGRHPVPRGLRPGRPRLARGARREGALPQGARRRGPALHRRLRSLRGSGEPGPRRAHGPRERRDKPGPGARAPRRTWAHRARRARFGPAHRAPISGSARMSTPALFPVFLRLEGRNVLLVGGGRVAAGKLAALLETGANVTVVAPEI